MSSSCARLIHRRRLVVPPQIFEEDRIPVIGDGIIRIYLDCPFEFVFRFRPLPRKLINCPQGGVWFSQLTVKAQGSLGIGLRQRERFAGRSSGVFVQNYIAICKTDVSKGEVRVSVSRGFELLDRFPNVFRRSPVPVITSFQISLCSETRSDCLRSYARSRSRPAFAY